MAETCAKCGRNHSPEAKCCKHGLRWMTECPECAVERLRADVEREARSAQERIEQLSAALGETQRAEAAAVSRAETLETRWREMTDMRASALAALAETTTERDLYRGTLLRMVNAPWSTPLTSWAHEALGLTQEGDSELLEKARKEDAL